MLQGHDLVLRLRDPDLSPRERVDTLQDFGRATGWRPSYEIDYPETRELACGHLLVEHGMQPQVAITFLRQKQSFDQLNWDEKRLLLSISYNNLVDWHYFPDQNGFWVAYNRTRSGNIRYISLADHPNAWMVEEFDKLNSSPPKRQLCYGSF